MLRKQIKKQNIKQVTLCGYTSDPQEVYKDASILCLTSSFEGWGLVLAEAHNNGVVPIAFECSAGVRP